MESVASPVVGFERQVRGEPTGGATPNEAADAAHLNYRHRDGLHNRWGHPGGLTLVATTRSHLPRFSSDQYRQALRCPVMSATWSRRVPHGHTQTASVV